MAKILIVGSFAESLINFRGNLITQLGSMGHVVYTCAPDITPDIADKLRCMGAYTKDISLKRNGLNPFMDIVYLFRLFIFIRNIQPDMVFAYTIKPIIYGVLAAWFAGVKRKIALVTGLGYSFTNQQRLQSKLGKLICFLYSFSINRADFVFFQNSDDRKLFVDLRIFNPEETQSAVINGSGVDIARFGLSPMPSGNTNFLMIARLLGDKGVREYAEAARQLKGLYPGAIFFLVGWIDENPDAISIKELDQWVSEGYIEYLGKLDDVRPALAQASVYVLPSYREGMPRTVLEAMSMGRPIITTDAPGCRETVIDGVNGFLVPVKTVSPLVIAMEKFILDPMLAYTMGWESRKIAEDKYDVKKINEAMIREFCL